MSLEKVPQSCSSSKGSLGVAEMEPGSTLLRFSIRWVILWRRTRWKRQPPLTSRAYSCWIKTLAIPSLTLPQLPFPISNHHSLVSMTLFWFCLLLFCAIFHIRIKSYDFCPFLSDLFHIAWYPQNLSLLTHMAIFHLFCGWVVFHHVYLTHNFYLFSSVDGHIDGFHILVLISNVPTNIRNICLYKLVFSYFSSKYSKDGLLHIW